MIWKDLPNWRLTWVDNSIFLKVDRTKRTPTTKLVHSEKNAIFETLRVGEKTVGYKLSLLNEFKCHDEGWNVCVFFEEPTLSVAEPLYHDKNVRLIKIGENYTFAIRWKQST